MGWKPPLLALAPYPEQRVAEAELPGFPLGCVSSLCLPHPAQLNSKAQL